MGVSVCITAYNVAPYIAQAIEGALMQKTSFAFEIVIGDDGSTDNTRKILLSYKKKYPDIIQLVLHDKNVGVARNDISVVKKAKGKYLAWCDGDDYWIDENKLQKQYDILEKFTDVSLVHTNWIDFIERENTFQERKIIQNELENNTFGIKCIEMLLLNESTGCRFSSSMFRKNLYLKTLENKPKLFLSDHVCNDFAVFVAMYEYGRFYHLPISSTVYRIRQESLSMTENREKRHRYMTGYFNLITQICKTYPISIQVKNKVVKKELNELLKYTFFYRKEKEAKKLHEQASSLNYKLSAIQRLLYWGSINTPLYILMKPVLSKILKY